MMLYAKAWLTAYPDAPDLLLAHAQFLKVPRKRDRPVSLVQALVSRETVDRFWDEVLVPLAETIYSMEQSHVTFDELSRMGETNGGCWDFGGCKFGRRGDSSCYPVIFPEGMG